MNTKDKPIGCICKDNSKCIICTKLEDPSYRLVRINLSPSRIIEGQKHLAPIALPVPNEVSRLMGSSRKTNGFVSNPDGLKQSPFSCVYGVEEGTTNKVVCPSCKGHTELKVFKCLLPEIKSCTVDRKVEGIQMCKDCSKFQAK